MPSEHFVQVWLPTNSIFSPIHSCKNYIEHKTRISSSYKWLYKFWILHANKYCKHIIFQGASATLTNTFPSLAGSISTKLTLKVTWKIPEWMKENLKCSLHSYSRLTKFGRHCNQTFFFDSSDIEKVGKCFTKQKPNFKNFAVKISQHVWTVAKLGEHYSCGVNTLMHLNTFSATCWLIVRKVKFSCLVNKLLTLLLFRTTVRRSIVIGQKKQCAQTRSSTRRSVEKYKKNHRPNIKRKYICHVDNVIYPHKP